MTAVAEEACCRFCFEGVCSRRPASAMERLSSSTCVVFIDGKSSRCYGGWLGRRQQGDALSGLQSAVHHSPPSSFRTFALVRGREGASLAALIRPGCLLVARDAVLDESTRARTSMVTVGKSRASVDTGTARSSS